MQEKSKCPTSKKSGSNLEIEKKRLLNELEQLNADRPSFRRRREGSPFGNERNETESLELRKTLAIGETGERQPSRYDDTVRKSIRALTVFVESCGKPD